MSEAEAPRYRLLPGIRLRPLADELVALELGERTLTVSTTAARVLLDLSAARTASELLTLQGGSLAATELDRLLDYGLRHGLLELDIETDAPTPELPFAAGPLCTDSGRARIAAALRAGRAVVIPDALESSFAEAVQRELDASTGWRCFEGFHEFFWYRHHNLYDPASFPPSLRRCQAMFDSPRTKAWIEALSGRSVDATIDFGASLYLPGDHSLPHTDEGSQRRVAFIWHLSKDWRADWGGQLVWCRDGASLVPQFNTLVLFDVSPASVHFVSAVSAHARGKRLTVNGWWRDEHEPDPQPRPRPMPTLVSWGYGADVEADEDLFIL